MSEDAHEYIMALKMYLLEELQPDQTNSNLTASNHPYDRELHMSMQTFWNLFCSGKTTQTVTCSECSNVTSRDDHFSEIMLKFPTPVENTGVRTRKITLAHLFTNTKTGVIDDYVCIPCNSRRSATVQEHISQCPKILTIVLSRNADNEDGSIDYKGSLTNIELSKIMSLVLTERLPDSSLTVFELVALGRQPFTNWIGYLNNKDMEIIQMAFNKSRFLLLQKVKKERKCWKNVWLKS